MSAQRQPTSFSPIVFRIATGTTNNQRGQRTITWKPLLTICKYLNKYLYIKDQVRILRYRYIPILSIQILGNVKLFSQRACVRASFNFFLLYLTHTHTHSQFSRVVRCYFTMGTIFDWLKVHNLYTNSVNDANKIQNETTHTLLRVFNLPFEKKRTQTIHFSPSIILPRASCDMGKQRRKMLRLVAYLNCLLFCFCFRCNSITKLNTILG